MRLVCTLSAGYLRKINKNSAKTRKKREKFTVYVVKTLTIKASYVKIYSTLHSAGVLIFWDGTENESENHLGMHRMQAKKLRHDEEQEKRSRTFGNEKVLPFLQEAHRA